MFIYINIYIDIYVCIQNFYDFKFHVSNHHVNDLILLNNFEYTEHYPIGSTTIIV